MIPNIRREITTTYELNSSLSYLNDYNQNEFKIIGQSTTGRKICNVHLNNTVAICQNGSSYVYPKIMTKGNLQIYPPIICTNLSNFSNMSKSRANVPLLIQISENNLGKYTYVDGTMSTHNIPSTYSSLGGLRFDPAYIFKNIFEIEYATMNNYLSYNTTTIPSFNPHETTTTKFAYIIGKHININDQQLAQCYLTSGIVPYSQRSKVITHLRIRVENNNGIALRNMYNTQSIPIAYNSNNGFNIIRRGASTDCLEWHDIIHSDIVTFPNSTNIYKFKYWFNGKELQYESNYDLINTVLSNNNAMCSLSNVFSYAATNINEAWFNAPTFEQVNMSVNTRYLLNFFFIRTDTNNPNMQNIAKRVKIQNQGQSSSWKYNTNKLYSHENQYFNNTLIISRANDCLGSWFGDIPIDQTNLGISFCIDTPGNLLGQILDNGTCYPQVSPDVLICEGQIKKTSDIIKYVTLNDVMTNNILSMTGTTITDGAGYGVKLMFSSTNINEQQIVASNSNSYTYFLIGANILIPWLNSNNKLVFSKGVVISDNCISVKPYLAQTIQGSNTIYFHINKLR